MSQQEARIEGGGHTTGGAIRRQEWLGFCALCLLGASAWLVEGAWPSVLPVPARQCLHDLAIAAGVGVYGWRSLAPNRPRVRRWAMLALASVCLLGIPAMLVEATRGGVSEVTIAQLFALLPVAVVVLVPHFDLGRTAGAGTSRLLAPALIGLTGTLLLLAFSLPGSWRQARLEAVVVIGVVVAAAASVWMYRLLAEFTVAEAVVICCLANAVFALALFAASSMATGSGWDALWAGGSKWNAAAMEMAKAILFDLPQIVLLLWLMRDVAPARLSARYLVVPLLTVLEGYALLRTEITLTSMVGAVLVVFGAWRMTTANERSEEPRLILR